MVGLYGFIVVPEAAITQYLKKCNVTLIIPKTDITKLPPTTMNTTDDNLDNYNNL